MKIFDLQCSGGHGFEGWFASEDDYQSQLARGLLSCPLCSDTDVIRVPSAPRLNLGGAPRAGRKRERSKSDTSPERDLASGPVAMQARLLHAMRHVMAHTEDVGTRFAEEARRMHYGDIEERSIRGQATPEQTRELLDEGIAVVPLPLPDALKDTLQ